MDKNKELIVVGTTSKLGNYFFKYPIRVILIFIIFGETVAFMDGADAAYLWRAFYVPLYVYIPVLFVLYLAGNKVCYKIEIDRSNNSITFYRIFNRGGACTFSLNKIKIVVGPWQFHIVADGSEFILYYQYIHELVSYLPKSTVIEYIGFLGNNMKNGEGPFYREKGPLMPGGK